MKKLKTIRYLFILAGAYDFFLGAAFLAVGPYLFRTLGIAPPNHWGYVHFPALLLMVFGCMFFQIAGNPVKHFPLILYGIALKASYCLTVFGHAILSSVPNIWIVFGVFDLAFDVLFILSFRYLKNTGGRKL
jgi:hypothetical protein